jgi:hypothetical protein
VSDTRKLVALFIAVMAFGFVVFGIVRGASSAGPASGTRLIVTIAPPVDADAVARCQEVAKARLPTARVVPSGERLVVEVPAQDKAAVSEATAKLEMDGGHHHMHVASATAFTRATGFFPRAWPFFAIAGVMLAIAALIWRKR